MQIYRSIEEFRAARRRMTGTTGFVPTMGALHSGHLELVHRAREGTGNVVLSIFVNPTQFASEEDAAAYPRTVERDLQLAEDAGVDAVLLPTAHDLYPTGFSTFVDVGDVATPLEGAARPNHFRGVATVVAKLLNIVQPDRAYFGHKDAQQLLVIRRMVTDLNIPVEIVGVDTVRDAWGVAISSRNALLSPDGLRAARCLNNALSAARERWLNGENEAASLRQAMQAVIEREPSATIDYASVADAETLRELDGNVSKPAIASLAVYIEGVRLIDNMRLLS